MFDFNKSLFISPLLPCLERGGGWRSKRFCQSRSAVVRKHDLFGSTSIGFQSALPWSHTLNLNRFWWQLRRPENPFQRVIRPSIRRWWIEKQAFCQTFHKPLCGVFAMTSGGRVLTRTGKQRRREVTHTFLYIRADLSSLKVLFNSNCMPPTREHIREQVGEISAKSVYI